jgi:hypothetical protein
VVTRRRLNLIVQKQRWQNQMKLSNVWYVAVIERTVEAKIGHDQESKKTMLRSGVGAPR